MKYDIPYSVSGTDKNKSFNSTDCKEMADKTLKMIIYGVY